MYIKKGGEPRASHMIEDNNNKYSNNDHNIENNNNKNVVNQSDPLTGHSAKKLKNRLTSSMAALMIALIAAMAATSEICARKLQSPSETIRPMTFFPGANAALSSFIFWV